MKKIVILLFLCFPALTFSQQRPIDSISQLNTLYKDYFSPLRESVYLQLNKTIVLPSENVWFSAYAFNSNTMLPSEQTTNLHVNLYSADGQLMAAKTVYMKDGKGEGFFDLDTVRYHPGNYMIKAFTKTMKNVKENLSFKQGLKILGQEPENTKSKPTRYDLQLLPEGGHLLANTENSIGVKLIDDKGRSHFFTDGKVLNAENHVVTTFKSNRFGLSKFRIPVKAGADYTVELTPDGHSPIRMALPKPERNGIALSVNNLVNNTLYVSISTNSTTLNDIGGEPFYVTIHDNGNFKSLPFVFPKTKNTVTLPIDKNLLAQGVNVITVFDKDFNPLTERQVFHHASVKRRHARAKLIRNRGDSIIFNLSADLKKENGHLSVSILPAKTKAYTSKHDILSALLIKPYIRGSLEDGEYYFSSGKERQKAYDMDLLLMTQGWSKYEWRHIFNGKPKQLYDPEHGFVISGRVNLNGQKTAGSQLMLKDTNSNLFQVVDLDEQNRFSVDKLYVEDSAQVSFGLVGTKKSKVNLPKVYARITPLPDTKPITIKPNEFVGEFMGRAKDQPSRVRYRDNFIASAEELEAVFLEHHRKQDLKKKHRHLSSFITGNQIVVDKDLADVYTYVTDVIEAHGFRVHRSMTGVSITTMSAMSVRGPARPIISLDGGNLGDDLSPLLTLKTSEVEAIYINKTGFGLGMKGVGGSIQIFTKMGTGNFEKKKSYETTQARLMKNGFARSKTFYAPRYTDYTSKLFENYGVIGWFPNVELSSKKPLKTLKFYNTGQRKVKLFIQGMTSSGHLISEEFKLKTR